MHEPLLERIRELERALRRWKTLCLVLGSALLAILVSGSMFIGFHGFRAMLDNQHALRAAEEARMQEMAARAQAEAMRQRAEEALEEAQRGNRD